MDSNNKGVYQPFHKEIAQMLRRAFLLLSLAAIAQAQVSAPTPLVPQKPGPQIQEPQKQVKTYTLPPEKLAKAIDYAHARNWLHFIGFA